MTRWNIIALTLYDSLMGNTHPLNVLRPLPGLMAFLIERWIRFTSPECCLGGSEHYGSILGGVPSNYIYSGSNPPSYAHSPLFPLEPTLLLVVFCCLLMECRTRQSGPYYDRTGLSPLRSHPLPPHQSHGQMNGTTPVPTYDLKRRYDELMDQQKKNDTMPEKNQRMTASVKRGPGEM